MEPTARTTPAPRRTVLTLPGDIRARLERAAVQHRRTLSAEATIAIERHIAEPRISDEPPRAA
jgi:TraY domain